MNQTELNMQKIIITGMLRSTKRKGIESLIEWLDLNGYFESPASKKQHSAYVGGLAKHSLNVYRSLFELNTVLRLETPDDSMVITALLHDVCKVGSYQRTKADDGWTSNPNKEKGHALLSVERVKEHIELTELEEKMILYHMGVYGLLEFDERRGEYTLRNKGMANAWYHHPVVKVKSICDEIAGLQEKAEEANAKSEG